MKKTVRGSLAIFAGVALAVGMALPANAASRGEDTPPPPPTSTEEKPAVEPLVVEAPPVEEPTAEVYWLMPETSTPIPPTGNNPSIWPQQYSPNGASTCGRWYQVDNYYQSDIAGLIADNKLTEGEDYDVVISWRFVYGGDCPPPPAPPVKPAVSYEFSSTCGVLNLTVHTVGMRDTWANGIKAQVDGVDVGAVRITGNGDKTETITFPEDSYDGSANVTIFVHSAVEWDWVPADWAKGTTHSATVVTDCVPAEVVVPPTVTPKPQPPVLAHTGVTTDWLVPVGGWLTLAGVLAMLIPVIRRKLV